jgi:crotonobetainyl-CoA:carnitine CoA-transferase CaiB-like acyl-CoA transferase
MGALSGIVVLDASQVMAGPFCAMHMADLGADVIKIEDPRTDGDVGRYVPPFQEGEDSLFFETFNRNKRSLRLDISNGAGRSVFEDLVRRSDVVYSNLRGDVPARLGLRYADLADVNPQIVCCSLSAFGMTGPRAAEPGYDYILQGIAGWMSITGEPDGPPTKSGLSLVDYCGGLVAAISLLAGVHAARRDGVGMDCDVSLFDTALAMLTYPAAWHLNGGFEPVRTHNSAHPSIVPFQNFRTADGWIVVVAAKEKFWQRLATALGRPDLATDARFATFDDRRVHASTLLPILDGLFAERPTEHWIDVLADAGVPCGPVNDVAGALRDPQTEARGMVVETGHPRFGTVRQVASPVRVGDDAPAYRRAPSLDEDRDPLLRDLLGYPPGAVEELRLGGAFGPVAD